MTQKGFDFDKAKPGGKVPKLLSPREQRMRDWLKPIPEPSGPPSDQLCASCDKPILIDDDFGLSFGEHAPCFE